MAADSETNEPSAKFDFGSFPEDTLFHDRREGRDRRDPPPLLGPGEPHAGAGASNPPSERRARKERRRRIDPTTFEKQYSDDELEFMNAMQRFKVQSGKSFPSHGDVLRVAFQLGYRRLEEISAAEDDAIEIEALPYPSLT